MLPYQEAPSASDLVVGRSDVEDRDLDASLKIWTPLYEKAARQLVENLRLSDLQNLRVSFLLDHSGSLRGEKCCLLAATTGIASECLAQLGVKHEVLGFTTRSWRGGQSREKWSHVGRPAAPGRLCDLLHIVYRDFQNADPVASDGLRLMVDPRILKENIDGEALEWANGRLLAEEAARRVLIVISDGAPVDDSTLLFNGPNILDDHLKLVARDIIEHGDVELYGVGLHYRMFRYYPQYVVIERAEDIGDVILPTLQAILSSSAHSPKTVKLVRETNAQE